MDAELTVELGANDPALAVPWASDDGRLRYYDLKHRPDLLLYVDEASRFREIAEFLVQVNSPASLLQSAKCDAWYSTELSEAEAIYGAAGKFVSYVDVFFADHDARSSFAQHEQFARRLIKLLERAPQISAAAEFILRRCYYQFSVDSLQPSDEKPEGNRQTTADSGVPDNQKSKTEDSSREGFYLTFYLSGYGDDEPDARKRWGIALKLTGNAILQLSAANPASS